MGFKQIKTDPCLLYRENNLGPEIFIVYVDYMLAIRYKPALMDTIECIKK